MLKFLQIKMVYVCSNNTGFMGLSDQRFTLDLKNKIVRLDLLTIKNKKARD